MTKLKNFWAFMAFACLILAGISGSSIYARLAVHFLNDTVEIKPQPVPLEHGNENLKEKEKADPGMPEEPEKQKAVKTLFEYKSATARSVSLAGSFAKWKELAMTRKAGIWKGEVYIFPGNYRYHFIVDGKKTLDPGKPKAPMGESMVSVEEERAGASGGKN